jgi:death-on-curing protein
MTPRWLDKQALLLLHSESLAEHGGLSGLRDENLLDSALARPENLLAYEGIESLPRLAASYCVDIARNHPFNDSNKRIAFIAMVLFLRINGVFLVVDPVEAVQVMLTVATGEMVEEALAEWIASHLHH